MFGSFTEPFIYRPTYSIVLIDCICFDHTLFIISYSSIQLFWLQVCQLTFSSVTKLERLVCELTYNVLMGALNIGLLVHSLTHRAWWRRSDSAAWHTVRGQYALEINPPEKPPKL